MEPGAIVLYLISVIYYTQVLLVLSYADKILTYFPPTYKSFAFWPVAMKVPISTAQSGYAFHTMYRKHTQVLGPN